MELNNKILSEITIYMKYARYIPELNRRETWKELVTRNKNMHIKKYPELKEEVERLKLENTKLMAQVKQLKEYLEFTEKLP